MTTNKGWNNPSYYDPEAKRGADCAPAVRRRRARERRGAR
jgi:hypothetical protein